MTNDDKFSEKGAAAEMAERLSSHADVEAIVFDGVREGEGKSVEPTRMRTSDQFNFRCHKGVSCWNVCCYGADVTLTPADILALARHFGIRPSDFVAHSVVPSIHPGSGLPVAKLVMRGSDETNKDSEKAKDGKGPCVFLDEEKGCTVYDSRPVTCRYYPLGLGAVKMKGHETREDMYFLVKESHCQGHAEDKEQSVGEFRAEQGVAPYDAINQGWVDLLMKMASWRSIGGPMGRDVSAQTKKMFYMVSTDIDAFRQFVFGSKFLDTYDLDDDKIELIREDDEALLQLGLAWLSNVMFNDPVIEMKESVLQQAIGAARSEMGGV